MELVETSMGQERYLIPYKDPDSHLLVETFKGNNFVELGKAKLGIGQVYRWPTLSPDRRNNSALLIALPSFHIGGIKKEFH